MSNNIPTGLKKAFAVKIVITVTNDGQVNVSGFPKNLPQATGIMDMGKNAVVNYFVQKARSGDLDDNGIVTDDKIIKPDKNIIRVQ